MTRQKTSFSVTLLNLRLTILLILFKTKHDSTNLWTQEALLHAGNISFSYISQSVQGHFSLDL